MDPKSTITSVMRNGALKSMVKALQDVLQGTLDDKSIIKSMQEAEMNVFSKSADSEEYRTRITEGTKALTNKYASRMGHKVRQREPQPLGQTQDPGENNLQGTVSYNEVQTSSQHPETTVPAGPNSSSANLHQQQHPNQQSFPQQNLQLQSQQPIQQGLPLSEQVLNIQQRLPEQGHMLGNNNAMLKSNGNQIQKSKQCRNNGKKIINNGHQFQKALLQQQLPQGHIVANNNAMMQSNGNQLQNNGQQNQHHQQQPSQMMPYMEPSGDNNQIVPANTSNDHFVNTQGNPKQMACNAKMPMQQQQATQALEQQQQQQHMQVSQNIIATQPRKKGKKNKGKKGAGQLQYNATNRSLNNHTATNGQLNNQGGLVIQSAYRQSGQQNFQVQNLPIATNGGKSSTAIDNRGRVLQRVDQAQNYQPGQVQMLETAINGRNSRQPVDNPRLLLQGVDQVENSQTGQGNFQVQMEASAVIGGNSRQAIDNSGQPLQEVNQVDNYQNQAVNLVENYQNQQGRLSKLSTDPNEANLHLGHNTHNILALPKVGSTYGYLQQIQQALLSKMQSKQREVEEAQKINIWLMQCNHHRRVLENMLDGTTGNNGVERWLQDAGDFLHIFSIKTRIQHHKCAGYQTQQENNVAKPKPQRQNTSGRKRKPPPQNSKQEVESNNSNKRLKRGIKQVNNNTSLLQDLKEKGKRNGKQVMKPHNSEFYNAQPSPHQHINSEPSPDKVGEDTIHSNSLNMDIVVDSNPFIEHEDTTQRNSAGKFSVRERSDSKDSACEKLKNGNFIEKRSNQEKCNDAINVENTKKLILTTTTEDNEPQNSCTSEENNVSVVPQTSREEAKFSAEENPQPVSFGQPNNKGNEAQENYPPQETLKNVALENYGGGSNIQSQEQVNDEQPLEGGLDQNLREKQGDNEIENNFSQEYVWQHTESSDGYNIAALQSVDGGRHANMKYDDSLDFLDMIGEYNADTDPVMDFPCHNDQPFDGQSFEELLCDENALSLSNKETSARLL